MASYTGYANGGVYRYKSESGSSGGTDGDLHFYVGSQSGSTLAYRSLINFPTLVENNKNIVVTSATLKIRFNGEGPCKGFRFCVTESDDPFSTDGADTAITFTTSTSPSEELFVVDLKKNSKALEKIALCHSKGKPFFIRVEPTEDNEGRIRFTGFKNTYYGDKTNAYLAPVVTFEYAYGISTGTLNKSSVKLGEAISLSISSLSDSYEHSVQWYIIDAENEEPSFTQTVSGSSSSSYTFPANDDSYAKFPTTSSSITGKVVLTTFWNTTKLGSNTYNFTVTLGNKALPTVSSYSIQFKDPSSTTNYQTYCLQNCSSIYSSVTAAGVEGATISKIQLIFSGAITGTFSFTGTNLSLSNQLINITPSKTGNVTVKIIATDSRGQKSNEKTITFTITSYSKPKFTSLNFFRSDGDGVSSPVDGTYVSGQANFSYSTVANNTISASIKINGTSIGKEIDGTTLTITRYEIGSGLAEIELTLTDKFKSSAKQTITIAGSAYLMHFRPVGTSGNSIGIGSPASTTIANSLIIGWPVYFKGGIAELVLDDSQKETLANNLGVLSLSGGTITGNLILNQESGQKAFITKRTIGTDIHSGEFLTSQSGSIIISYLKNGTELNKLTLTSNSTTLMNPLDISSGGTGVTSLTGLKEILGLESVADIIYESSLPTFNSSKHTNVICLIPVS